MTVLEAMNYCSNPYQKVHFYYNDKKLAEFNHKKVPEDFLAAEITGFEYYDFYFKIYLKDKIELEENKMVMNIGNIISTWSGFFTGVEIIGDGYNKFYRNAAYEIEDIPENEKNFKFKSFTLSDDYHLVFYLD